jgi:hypothetical protein
VRASAAAPSGTISAPPCGPLMRVGSRRIDLRVHYRFEGCS